MALINENFLKLKAGYLFPEIARRVKAFTESNADAAARLPEIQRFLSDQSEGD